MHSISELVGYTLVCKGSFFVLSENRGYAFVLFEDKKSEDKLRSECPQFEGKDLIIVEVDRKNWCVSVWMKGDLPSRQQVQVF